MPRQRRPNEEARIQPENEAFLTGDEGRRAMIEWLVERDAPDLQRDSLAELPILDLARLFAARQYVEEMLSRPTTQIDIPLLGRIASQYVATRDAQAERGRSGGSRSKRKEGIWKAAFAIVRDRQANTARDAFRYLLAKTNMGEPFQIDGWQITASQPGRGRHADGKVGQKHLQTESRGEIRFRTFETDYWSKAKREVQ
jgi:hypothetical protein